MIAPPESAVFDASALEPALRVLVAGGVVAYPTEAVYGLGCLPWCESAVDRVRVLKHRPREKGLIVVAASFDQLRSLVEPSGIDMERVFATWPGPVTWVFPAHRNIPRWLLGSDSSLAVRVSAHPLVQALCRKAGPLISTSANRANLPPARTAMRVRACFGRAIDLVVPGRIGTDVAPSQIRRALNGDLIRKGG